MPRNEANVYSLPAGTEAVTGTTVSSAKFNQLTRDVEADLNTPRPVSAGGTGVSTVAALRDAIGKFDRADLAELLADEGAYPAGTKFFTRAEGYAYEVVASAPHITTAGGAMLRVLPVKGEYNLRAFNPPANGSGDDTPAFMAAAAAAGNATVFIPAGVYLIHEILCDKGTLWRCENATAEVTANANGSGTSPITLRYNGAGGASSFMFKWQAGTYGQYIYGGGLIGRPTLNGMDLCATGFEGRSTARQEFDLSIRRVTYAGGVLNSGNGALSFMCTVRLHFAYGSIAAVENAHGIVLTGEVDNKGCTQHDIKTEGVFKHGDMVRMGGNCDNNRLTVHGSDGGSGSGATGHSIAMYDGAVIHPRNNLIYYTANSMYQSAGCVGNVLMFTPSEGQVFTGKLPHIKHLGDYVNGDMYSTPTYPLHKRVMFSASEMAPDGATLAPLAAGIGAGYSLANDTTERGAVLTYAGRDITKGRVTGIRIGYSGTTSGAFAFRVQIAVVAPTTGFVADLDTTVVAPTPTSANNYSIHDYTLPTPIDVLAGSMISIKVSRLPANAFDTNTGPATLLSAGFNFASHGPINTIAGNPAMPEFSWN